MSVFLLMVIGWCFLVGASVGSFLNVVAWRLPLGMSLSKPPSHCPRCQAPILFRDNVPVLGWLWLRGRCRACGLPISPRYPIVEFLCGAAFAVLGVPELAGGGVNLPWAELRSHQMLVAIWVYHAVLVSLLIALALFAIDGASVPRRFVVAGVVLGIVPPQVWPTLYPVPVDGLKGIGEFVDDLAIGGQPWAIVCVGLAAGAALGAVLAIGSGNKCGSQARGAVALALAFCGLFLGWQSALSIACMVTLAGLAARALGFFLRRNVPVALFVPCATLAQIVAWRPLNNVLWWPGPYTSGVRLAVACGAVVALNVALALVDRVRRSP